MTVARATIPFWSTEEIDGALGAAIAHLNARRVLAYPTETVYGFGGGIDQESVDALVAIKHRPPDKPFLLLISDPNMLVRLDLQLNTSASALAAHFWPGPLTLVLPGGKRRVPEALRGVEGGIAVRWTPHVGLLRLIQAYGDPITSTSANVPGQPPAMAVDELLDSWRTEIAQHELLVLDGGRLPPSAPSTVVDCMDNTPRIIRHGAISPAELRKIVPSLRESES